jgi:hypothetical protein
MLIFVLSILLIFLIYKWGTSTFDYFEKRGVAHKKPIFLFGNASNVLTRKLAFPEIVKKIYNDFPNEKYGDFFHRILELIEFY